MVKKFFLLIIIALIISKGIFCDFNKNGFWYNPNGWKLPVISKFKKIKTEKLKIRGIDEKIIIEHFSKKGGKPYYIFDNDCDRDYSVFLNRKTRYEINYFRIVKLKKGKFDRTLLYVIDYIGQDVIIENQYGEIITVYNAGLMFMTCGLLDVDNSGKFKYLYDIENIFELDSSTTINERISPLIKYSYKRYIDYKIKK